MKSTYFEKGLALLAALIVIVGLSNATMAALAGDFGTIEIPQTTHI